MDFTKILYLDDIKSTECNSKVLEVIKDVNKNIIILNQTIFYPQGGGQPCDKGIIESKNSTFAVNEVKIENNLVKHIGIFVNGFFNKSELVTCKINKERRLFLSRLHSAGHVVDIVVSNLEIGWRSGKGYHYPEGPYVEYYGILDENERENLRLKIEKLSNELIKQNLKTSIKFVNKQELKEIYGSIPDYISLDKPIRVIMFGNFGIPCGGTHVNSLSEIKKLIIRKIKINQGNIRVAYDIEK